VVSPLISFVADVTEPDLYNDVNGLPDPFSMNIILGITNTHTATLYFKASITSPPAAYTSSSTNLGSLAPGQSGFFVFAPARHPPTLTAGEYDETLTFRIDAYTDAGYSAAYANQTLSVAIHHFDHADAAWTVVEHAAFDSDLCGWTYAGGFSGTNPIDPTHFYSSPASMKVMFLSGGGSSYCPGTATKALNTGAKTKARIIFHIYHQTSGGLYTTADDDAIRVTVGGVVKKPRALPLPLSAWARLAYNFPVNANVAVEFWCRGATYDYNAYWVDEIWVISK
jgi:hypothetical protein